MDGGTDSAFRLHRVYSSDLDESYAWYAVSSALADGKLKEFASSDVFQYFKGELVEINRDKLSDEHGARVPSTWFCNRKRDVVFVCTLFGLFARSLRRKHLDKDLFLECNEFQDMREQLKKTDYLLAGENCAIFETPPTTPENQKNATLRRQERDDNQLTKEFLEKLRNGEFSKRKRAKRDGYLAKSLRSTVTSISKQYSSEDLGLVLGKSLVFGGEFEQEFAKEVISSSVDVVRESKGLKNGLKLMLGSDTLNSLYESYRVPDWQQLYVKLLAKLPDKAWQTILNFLHTGRTGKNNDIGLLRTKNDIKATRELIFGVTRNTFVLQKLPPELRGFSVNLESILVWCARECRLHNQYVEDGPQTIEFSLKLDGRPLAGRDQVSVGVVPIKMGDVKKCQSSLSVYPLAIANCSENRIALKQVIARLKKEKKAIKDGGGITVDGKKFKVKFKVTLDLKSLLLLLVKDNDENFELGGCGVELEFCFICNALRACKQHWNSAFDEKCETCKKSKSNIGRWTGLRKDLEFLFDEELSNITICVLHCSMRNIEQLLGSLGLFAYRCDALDECNEALSNYGPENSRKKSRIAIKEAKGQTTEITKSNVSVASFSGNTARKILQNSTDIVTQSLPFQKVVSYYKSASGTSKSVVLKAVRFTNSMIIYLKNYLKEGKFTRDFGDHQENVALNSTRELKRFIENEIVDWTKQLDDIEEKFLSCEELDSQVCSPPRKRKKKGTKPSNAATRNDNNAMAELAATLQISYMKKIFDCWREIESTMTKETFEEGENEGIDILDIKCKLWGFLLRHVHGVSLGGGDYIHYVVEHAATQLRMHRSLRIYSNQGFEASHKEHRALYSRASSHDKVDVSQSIEQIIIHWLSRTMLSLRLQFHEAQVAIDEGKKFFHYRGCDWKKRAITWSGEDKSWIKIMNALFSSLYGPDSLKYEFIAGQGTRVCDDTDPRDNYHYVHSTWEAKFKDQLVKDFEQMTSLTDNVRTCLAIEKDAQSPTGILPTCKTPSKEGSPPSTIKVVQPVHKASSHPHGPQPSTVMNSSSSSTLKVVQPVYKASSHPHGPQPSTVLNSSSSVQKASSSPALKNKVTATPNPTTVILDDCTSDYHSPLLNTSLSRKQFASIPIPPVGCYNTHQSSFVKYYGPFIETDPLSIVYRPPEAYVKQAESEMRRDKKILAIIIGDFGCFSRKGINLILKMSLVKRINHEIQGEKVWLDKNDGLSNTENNCIQEVLWNCRRDKTLLKAGSKSIDLQSFVTLAEERYLDNFVIDTVICKVIELERLESGNESTLYLPSEMFSWVESSNSNFKRQKFLGAIGCQNLTHCELVLLPVHMNGSHWGLFVVDVANQRFLFDDGLKIHLDAYVITSVKKALDMLLNVQPTSVTLQSRFWDSINVWQRFGMPDQNMSAFDGTGSGSCGMGVILAATDFVRNGLTVAGKFKWNFGQMRRLRKLLMLTILHLSSHKVV